MTQIEIVRQRISDSIAVKQQLLENDTAHSSGQRVSRTGPDTTFLSGSRCARAAVPDRNRQTGVI